MTLTRRSQEKAKDTTKPTEETAEETPEETVEAVAEAEQDTTTTDNQVEDVEMKEGKTEEVDEQKEDKNDQKKDESMEVEVKEDEETKKNRLVDQLYKSEFLKSVTETITIEPVKSQMLKNEEFIGLLSKAKVLNLQMEHQTGTVKLTFAPYREWMASRILKGLNRLQKEDAKLNLECSEALKALLELEKAGKLKGDTREQQTSKCLYVTNIPKDTTEETMKAFFPKCVKVFVRGESEESALGWAVMEFSSKTDMEESFESQKEIEMGESKIPVSKVKPFEKRGKGFKGKGKYQNKGGLKGSGDKANLSGSAKTKPIAAGGDKPKGGSQQSNASMKANDLKRKAQNQKMQQFNSNQKRRKLGGGPMSGPIGSFQFGNRNNKNMRGSGMGMSILGNPRGGNSMMNLGIGPSVPNMMGMGGNMGGNMGNMMGMGGNMGGNMGGMGMGQNMGMMGNNMGGNMSSFNNMGGNMGNQKNKRNNKRGGNMDNRGGQWSGGPGRQQDGPSDELSSKLSNVLSKQRMGQDSDSDMVSMLESALKAAQKRMSNKDTSPMDRDRGRMLPPSAFSGSVASGVGQGNKKQRPRQNKKNQNSMSSRWGSGSGSGSAGNYGDHSGSSTTSFISTTGGNYGSRDSSSGYGGSSYNSGATYDSPPSYGGSSGSSSSYFGGTYGGTTDQPNTGSSYYDQANNYGTTQSSYNDTSSYAAKSPSQTFDYSHRSTDSSYGNYRSGYY
ncbi:uncharacterized transmembrane protein DDB_G0289901-like [Mizuhopecten yessoensis]|uniref:uncharacterized transmembrane protein DDB_G0289901-like n=1 Tax=Mizuhopecten yessoensis TaxID=6573 RepID=UPI000B45B067|nr:uncharacterized transmembrane protein DDB_G0289901-like [Mizuhopecten yessoensis]